MADEQSSALQGAGGGAASGSAFGPWGALIGAGIGAAGSIFGAQETNAANRGNQDKQNRFNRKMAETAHQREVKDLRAAGLNPILSANGGSTVASTQPIAAQNEIGPGVTSALDALRLRKEIKAVDSQTDLNEMQGKTAAAIANREASSAKQIEKQTQVLETQMKAIKARAEADEKGAKYDSQFSDVDAYGKRLQMGLGITNSAKDLVNPWKNVLPKGYDKTKTGEIFRKSDGLILERK